MRFGWIVVLVVMQAAVASAAERIALGAFDVVGHAASDAQRAQLRNSLQGGLETAGLQVVTPPPQKCETNVCLRELGVQLGVERVVRARIEVVGGSTYALTFELIGTTDGRTLHRVEDRCQVCTVAEVNESVSNAARQLVLLAPPEGQLVEAPAVKPAAAAAPTVTAAPVPQEAPKRRWKLWVGVGVGVGVAVAALAIGLGVGLSQHGTDFAREAASGCVMPGCTTVDLRP